MTKIYVVYDSDDWYMHPVVAFTSEELAEAHARQRPGSMAEPLVLMDRLPQKVAGHNGERV